MKKMLFIVLAIALIVCFVACEVTPATSTDTDTTTDVVETPSEPAAETPTEPTTETPSEPPETPTTTTRELTVRYYDGETLLDTKVYTRKITLIDYTNEDRLFFGWYTDPECQTEYEASKTSQYFELKNINLYAKTENIMETFEITITGKVSENETVLNPLFTWAAGGETSFVAALYLNNALVDSKNLTSPSFRSGKKLKVNSEYVLSVTGGSGAKSLIRFKTVNGTNTTAITPITMSDPFMDNMVLQRGVPNVISGIGPANALISVTMTTETATEHYSAVSNDKGRFEVTLPVRAASFTPSTIRIETGLVSAGTPVEKTISNVLFGDVYLFAGQSNMQWLTKDSDYEQSDIDAFSDSYVRFFCQNVVTSATKKQNVTNGRWFIPGGTNCDWFSAIATMTGSFLGTALKEETPVGILTAYQGDTNIANWMGEEYYSGTCSTKNLHYNAMVYPLHDANLSGVVWYQGCNNSAAAYDYKTLLGDLFRNYRDLFRKEDLPFFVIGLACFDGDKDAQGKLDPMHNPYDFSFVRESQAAACAADENAYFISTCDDGDPTYIHPRAKRYICERVAKSIGVAIYGNAGYAEGPSYKSHEVVGNTVTIELNNAEGLTATGEITGLYLAGADGKYHAATAAILDGKIVASSDKVTSPVYVKYGFLRSPFVNIYNKDGFVITPFRTDVYDTNIDLFEYDTVANYTFHPDGAAMEVALTEGGNLSVSMANDGKGYGSVRLEKYSAIAYHPERLAVTFVGKNTGAKIYVRFVEGSGEIWGCEILDNFTGEQTVFVDVDDFTVLYDEKDHVFDTQKIKSVEFLIKYDGALTLEVCNVRFVEKE